MRIVYPLAAGIVAMAAAALPLAASSQQGESPYRPTATIREIMDSMVAPSAQVLWDAVGVEVSSEGVIERSPKTDEDWLKLRFSAVTLAEATNSLVVPGRGVAPDDGTAVEAGNLGPRQIAERIASHRDDWVSHAHALDDAVATIIQAIDAHDVDGLTDAGGTLDEACESCHLQFWYPPAP